MDARDGNTVALAELETMVDDLEQKVEAVETLSLVVSEPFVGNAKALVSILNGMRKQVSWMHVVVIERLLAHQVVNVDRKT